MVLEIKAIYDHAQPAKFCVDIRSFGDFLNAGFPNREYLCALSRIGSNSKRAAAMVQNHFCIGGCICADGKIFKLWVVHPSFECMSHVAELAETRLNIRCLKGVFVSACVGIMDFRRIVVRDRIPDPAKTASACVFVRGQNLFNTIAEHKVSVRYNACGYASFAVTATGTHGCNAVYIFSLTNGPHVVWARTLWAPHGCAFNEDCSSDVMT